MFIFHKAVDKFGFLFDFHSLGPSPWESSAPLQYFFPYMDQSNFPDEITASTLQAMPDAVIAVDVRGLIRFINSRAENLTGYVSAELHGRNVDVLVPASRRGGHRRNVSDYQHAPEAREMGDRRGLGLRRKDGIIVPFAISLSPLVGSEDRIVITTVRDVSQTERRYPPRRNRSARRCRAGHR